jgi:hypothetical protein
MPLAHETRIQSAVNVFEDVTAKMVRPLGARQAARAVVVATV